MFQLYIQQISIILTGINMTERKKSPSLMKESAYFFESMYI